MYLGVSYRLYHKYLYFCLWLSTSVKEVFRLAAPISLFSTDWWSKGISVKDERRIWAISWTNNATDFSHYCNSTAVDMTDMWCNDYLDAWD